MVLRERNVCACSLLGYLNGDGVVVFGSVWQPGKRTKMAVLQQALRLQSENNTLIFIRFSLPFSLPDDGLSLLPIRDDMRPVEILLDQFRVHERVPDVGKRGINGG